MTTVAWIGLGAMGGRMAGRLAGAGHDLVLWNRTRSRADDLAARLSTGGAGTSEAGAGGTGGSVRVAGTPGEAVAGAEVVFLMLADPAAVRAVSEGPDGLVAAVRPGTTVIDMSTIGPAATAGLRESLPGGVTLIDAPVLGSLAEAESGTLTLFVGGPEEAVERQGPLLSLLGAPVRVGGTGAGAAAKLVANGALLGVVGVLGESLALADDLGLPREVAWQVLARTPLGAQAERRRAAVESGSYPPRFALAMAAKDSALITQAAGRELRLAEGVRDWLADARAAGLGESDYTALLAHILSAPARSATDATPVRSVTDAASGKPASDAASGKPASDAASGKPASDAASGGPTPNAASGRPVSDAAPEVVSVAGAPHYQWGDGCDGWRLADADGLSVIEERMPPGTAEVWHLHERARQFFYVLDGRAVMRTPGREAELNPGDGVEIPPGLPHQLANVSAAELRFLAVSGPTTRGDRITVTQGVE
ncbi:cupin domain-containing protein [Nonomuraea sp. NN258]|uniref:NAD(P)-binding domain-containing protein n=1 Tax=Nonomuraea antri TaxID=2730852 RepID=UPI00156A5A15|nr:NAD(P)-binding domain-containing protein [Nonomuraea antri]NRQ39178.1 cupin domain-containing protein [Nonomuraea antri]